MATNTSQLPLPPLPAGYRRRVVVKFSPGRKLPYTRDAQAMLQADGRWSALDRAHAGVALAPYFSTLAEPHLDALAARPVRAGGAGTDFRAYYAIECPADADPEQVAAAVRQWPDVEIAYVEGGPVAPPLDPSNDPRAANQHYLDAAPAGIDARWMWSLADGTGVGFVDMERGWTLNHEDLAAAGITVISGLSTDFFGHGTAVLGEVVAVDNTRGGIGIAPKASARVVSQWRTASTYNTAEAILSAAAVMGAGDVLLLEAQTNYGGYSLVPVETEQAVFDAIAAATTQGIVVVEAGGNGSVDLDTVRDANNKLILNRNSADFRDSGAIMVGAGSSAAPHSRLGFSNFGSRIDCFGWGENIDTSGDGWTGNATNTYTTTFGGTSGASPIVSGAALLLQSWRVATGQARYAPDVLRALLSNPAINTHSANPPSDRIGVLPNLRSIVRSERGFAWGRWFRTLAWAWMILLGGLLITPGGVWCIACGPQAPGFVGTTLVVVLAVVSIALGLLGLSGVLTRSGGAAGGR